MTTTTAFQTDVWCPSACAAIGRHVRACTHNTDGLGQPEWCPTCRTRVPVEDQFTASQMTAGGETEYHVTALECGHEVQGEARVTGPAPGAPYAPGAYSGSLRHAGAWARNVAIIQSAMDAERGL